MPANPTLAKHYDHLEPEERLVAVLSALARRDEPEATRLADSCPRLTYTCGDPAFFDGLHLALDAAALAAGDLQRLCGRLDGLAWAADAVRAVTPVHRIGAMTAYLQGVRQGHERAGGADDPYGPAADGGDGLGRPLDTVADRAEAALAVLPEVAERNAGWVVERLAAVWAALGRYSERRLGVPAETLLGARGMRALAAEVAAALARHPDVTPDPDGVAEYLKLLDLCWGTRFGPDDVGQEGTAHTPGGRRPWRPPR